MGIWPFSLTITVLAATVPMPVRLIALLDLPVFLAIFVIEKRKKRLWTITALYFGVAGLYLATGSRGGTLSLALALWYVARIKSSKRTRILAAGVTGRHFDMRRSRS